MSASRMLSAKLLEPTTTVSPLAAPAVSSLSGSEVSSEDPHPASRTVAAASATAATPGFFLRDLRCAPVKVTIPVPELRGCKGVQGPSRGGTPCTDPIQPVLAQSRPAWSQLASTRDRL